MHTWKLLGHVLRRFAIGYNLNGRLAHVYERCGPTYGKLGSYREELNLWFREQSKQVARACRRQFEFIVAQRIKRNVQIFHLYTRIWDEVALREFMRSWRLRVTTNILMSTVGVTMYNWDRERISDEEINRCSDDIDDIYRLRDHTVVCTKCRLRTVIDTIQPNVKYCICSDTKPSCSYNYNSEGWEPFIERQDMLIWRRQESGGLYAYKVYGSFSDVTADDFLQVQVDVDYRLEWDNTAEKLQIIESDPQSESSADQSNDIIYWEMIWPKLFSNRDYVYQRRWVVDKEKRVIIIVNRVTEHPEVPARRGTHRVKTYWSYMVIRPYTDFHEPGIEFGLTYFDDPGVTAPSAVTAWVALRGLPEFLMRMRQATKNYQDYKVLKQGATSSSNSSPFTLPTNEQIKQDDSTKNANELDIVQRSDVVENDNKDTSASSNEQGLLHYFYITKLFA